MINIQFNIRNPWSDRFYNIKCWSWKISKHKSIELEILKSPDIIDFHFGITHRQSHAGFEFEMGLVGYNIHFMFYDIRHWDYTTQKWEIYETDSKASN
jgi:hypothetical protein